MKHEMKSKNARTGEIWKQCDNCGAANHGGFWWLGGYKSKLEPDCTQGIGDDWKKTAIFLGGCDD